MDSVKDTGPLDWRIAIVGQDGRPTPEFQRRWATQRTNNGLIGTIAFGVGAPLATPKPDDGAEYVNTATTPYTVFLGNGGTWHQAGVVAFTDLTDAPHTYTANALALLRVKSTVNGVEFVTQSGALDSLGSPASGQLLQRGVSTWALVTISTVLDTISSTRGTVLFRGASAWSALTPGTSGNVLTTAGAGADPGWVAPSGGGGGALTLISKVITVASQTSVTFTAIPASFTDLIISISGKVNNLGSGNVNIQGRFNNDSGANYDWALMQLFTTGDVRSDNYSDTSAVLGTINTTSVANQASMVEIVIGNYGGTTFFKWANTSSGFRFSTTGGSMRPNFGTADWHSTAAISRVDLFPAGGASFTDGTSVALYGRG